MLRDAASRAVKELEAAQEAIDVVLKSTTGMINKEGPRFSSDGESETIRSLNSGRYSRFEAELSAIQSDLTTFCVEPEDAADYGKWKLGFELGDYEEAIEGLIEEYGVIEGVYGKVVPNAVDEETFWCRYFYRVEKLKQREKMRASIVKMAISNDDDDGEELSWDVDDDDDGKSKGKTESVGGEKGNVVELSEKSGVDEREGKSITVDEDVNDEKGEEVVGSNQEEEDVGWDEIGDVGSGDGGGGSPNKDNLRKRLAVEEDDVDDDMNWGIEEDDEPVK